MMKKKEKYNDEIATNIEMTAMNDGDNTNSDAEMNNLLPQTQSISFQTSTYL